MALKVWNILLIALILVLSLIGFLFKLIPIFTLVTITGFILAVLLGYVILTRPDPLARVPSALEIERVKRKMKAEEDGLIFDEDE
ncbi:MAG TPA: hypothetical protein VN372_14775 [Methanospirillum sp.]|nr:hypothetical protein [Methanospirillum sp.]